MTGLTGTLQNHLVITRRKIVYVFAHSYQTTIMRPQKTVIVGAGPVGALAALYAAERGHEVEVYELRNGQSYFIARLFSSYCHLRSSLRLCCRLQAEVWMSITVKRGLTVGFATVGKSSWVQYSRLLLCQNYNLRSYHLFVRYSYSYTSKSTFASYHPLT